MAGGQLGRLPTRHDGSNNVGRKECEREESADLAGGNTLLVGNVIDADGIAGRELSEPGIGLGNRRDQNRINRFVVMTIAHDQPCLDTAPS